jgi:Na+-driven multidrug efflux pump
MGSVSILYLLFAYEIVGWFNENPVVIENGGLCLQIIAMGYIFYAYGMVVTQAFNGAGDTGTPTKINFLAFWMFQLPVAYLMALIFDLGAMGVFIAITTAEVLLAIIAIVWFKKGNWKKVQV